MAIPRFLVALLVLPTFLSSLLALPAASEHQCDSDGDSLGCHEIDDDTGLMQQPVRGAVEVTKVRGVVGNALSQEHEGSAASLVQATKKQVEHTVENQTGMLHELVPEATATKVRDSGKPGRDHTDLPSSLRPDEGLSFFQDGTKLSVVVEDSTSQADDANDILPAELEQAGTETVPSPAPVMGEAALANKPMSELAANVASHRPIAWAQATLVFAIVVVMLRTGMLRRTSASRQDALSAAMRQKLECIRVATGPEVRSVLGSETDKAGNSGVLMRIQGRIVEKTTGSLAAPLSNRPCVQYSASVSQQRHDGVHQPPVAFHSAAKEFAVQLEDCPEMLLEVQGRDVFPFDMESGRYACELAFVDAPDSWRSFLLAHLTPSVEGGGATGNSCALSGRMNCVDLGAKGPLKFRECALVAGARVTCVGEVVRERNGTLRLCPWSPPADEAKPKSRAMPWLNSKPDPWVNKLMISDDSRLLEAAQSLKCRSCS